MAVEIVVGSAARKRKPGAHLPGRIPVSTKHQVAKGKTKKTKSWTKRCNRQSPNPRCNCPKGRFNPCKRKIITTAAFVASPARRRPSVFPPSGHNHAKAKAPRSPTVNPCPFGKTRMLRRFLVFDLSHLSCAKPRFHQSRKKNCSPFCPCRPLAPSLSTPPGP